MSISICRFAGLAAVVAVLVCRTASAQILLDDHFDDGTISTNTTGIGSGFTALPSGGGSVSEAGTLASLAKNPPGYAQIVSNDTVNAFDVAKTSTVWRLNSTGGLLDTNPGNRRVVLGLQTGTTAAGALFLPLGGNANQAGLWVYLTDGVNPHPTDVPLGAHGNLIFVSSTGAGTSLAKWDWQSYNMSGVPNVTVTLDTTATTYDLYFSQAVKNVVGSLTGTLPNTAPSTVRVGVFDQIGGGAIPGTTGVDRITIGPPVINTDFNGDTHTDIADFHLLRDHFLTGTTHADGDANFNDIVDFRDYFLWRTAFLAGGGSAADIDWSPVPEPSVSLLVLICGSVGASYRRASRRIRK